jgi:hypothetical protein
LRKRLCLLDVAPLGNVDTVQELTDILVANAADLLDVGGRLGDVLDGVTTEDELVLDVLGGLDFNALTEGDAADKLLAEEVPAHSLSVSAILYSNRSLQDLRGVAYLISTTQRPVSLSLSRLTLMGKWA